MNRDLILLAGLIGFTLLTMLLYRLRGATRSADQTGRGGSFALGFWIRNWFYWFIRPVKRVSLALRLSPFFFNALVILLGAASLVLFARGNLPAAGWMILLSGFADVMDGEIARALGIADARGAFLDSTLDRFSELAVFVGIAMYFQTGLPVLSVIVAVGGSMLVSYTRARGESLGLTCKLGFMQRAERLLLLGFGAILDPTLSELAGRDTGWVLEIIVALVAVGTVATAIFRTVWIARRLGRTQES